MPNSELLVYGYYLNGDRFDENVLPNTLIQKNQIENSYWFHFKGDQEKVRSWLRSNSEIDSYIIEAMLTKQTRARFIEKDDTFLIILKAINKNLQVCPENVVSIRMYVEEDRIVILCLREFEFLSQLEHQLLENKTSLSPYDLFILIVKELFFHIEEIIENLDEEMDRIDEALSQNNDSNHDLITSLSQVRLQSIILKSYLTPQKEAFHALIGVQVSSLSEKFNSSALNWTEKITFFLELLDVVRERALVVLDEIRTSNAEKTNRNSYIFSIVALIFLPLGFLTGLFGINLAGIPWAESSWAFSIFCLCMLFIISGMFVFLKRIKWI